MNTQRQTLLDYAIFEARSGRRARAAEVLWQIVADDPGNAEAWLWLSGVVVEPADQRAALERVIALDPNNAPARHGLDWLREHHPELWSASDRDAAVHRSSMPAEGAVRVPERSVAGAWAPGTKVLPPGPVSTAGLADDTTPTAFATAEPAVEYSRVAAPEPTANGATEQMVTFEAPIAGQSAPDDIAGHEELRCPDCGEWATAADARCPRCQTSLIAPRAPSFWARAARWTMALLWLLSAAGAILGSIALLRISQGLQTGSGSLTLLFNPLLLGISPDVLLRTVSGMGLALGGVALIGVLMAIGLLARSRVAYVLHTLLALAALVGAIALVFVSLPMVSEFVRLDAASAGGLLGGLLGLPLVQVVLALLARRDFFASQERVYLPVEPCSADEHFRLGSRYGKRGWRWAAARELEQAVEQEPQTLKYRRALADVYASMGNHARAREELRASLNLQPDTSPAGRAGAIAEEVQRERE